MAGVTATRVSPLAATSSWLRGSRLGLVVMALGVGIGAGIGAVVFRWMIYGFTWFFTGRQQFGQQGRVASLHLPWLGFWFVLLVPVVGGLLYGPLIQRFAREARGHGVPEVMIAVAEHGGRIRPQVTVVKAVASALCIGVGGSVGREGPIVQIGSAFASTLGQIVRMSENRMRTLVACGAAGGIAATFNAPITGVFFGFELILREFSIDALFAIILSSMMADLISQAVFGSGPFFSQMPHNLAFVHDVNYLLIVVLGLLAGLIGVGFKALLYKTEDVCDKLWKDRPEWARPAVGGLALGVVLLLLPQLYGVGYPVMGEAVAGRTVLWLLLLLMVGKMFAASLTIGIGGSGGVFAPSLFTGAMGGTAFGMLAAHVFGPSVGSPATYGVVAMGAVFASAAQAPLTSIASVVEMTGNFGLTLPVMLAVGIASGLSKRLSYGTIYTTKLLRLGTDIDRPRPSTLLQVLTVAETMQPLPDDGGRALAGRALPPGETAKRVAPGPGTTGPALPAVESGTPTPQADGVVAGALEPSPRLRSPEEAADDLAGLGQILDNRPAQAVGAEETLEHALRQLVLYGPVGLPVLSSDRTRLVGWITEGDVLRAMARRVQAAGAEMAEGNLAAEWALDDPIAQQHTPPSPLPGYTLVDVAVAAGSVLAERPLGEMRWPPGVVVTAATRGRRTLVAHPNTRLRAGDRVLALVPLLEPAKPMAAEPSLDPAPPGTDAG